MLTEEAERPLREKLKHEKKNLDLFYFVYESFAYMYAYSLRVQGPWVPQGTRCPQNRVTDGC